ncbi:MAG: GNAT family N-acetyltransferase [Methylophaga sp.]|nr:GNAT family N-acetyltransferase [Methylophaga sp.]
MTSIRNTHFKELKNIYEMGYQSHIGEFLSIKSLETHEIDFKKDSVIYLSIISTSGLLAGYIILCKEKQSKTVQLKRILIDEKYLGKGQEAMISLESHCIRELKSNHIWLDVYKTNSKAIYVYEKLGYKKFKQNIQNSKLVLFYEKKL